MKVRFFRVVWLLSVLWLSLLLYGGIFGIAQDQLFLNLIVFGWPSAIGIIATYVATGTLFWPRDRQGG